MPRPSYGVPGPVLASIRCNAHLPTPCRRALLTACSDRVGPYSAYARSLWELGSHPAARLMQQRGHLAPLIILATFRQAERRVPAAQNSRSSSGHEWAPRPSAMACGMARGERQCTAADAESKIKAKAKILHKSTTSKTKNNGLKIASAFISPSEFRTESGPKSVYIGRPKSTSPKPPINTRSPTRQNSQKTAECCGP